MTETDRMKKAANYVLGLMDDDERERAERDLEIDPSFRDAVVEIAQRMHVFDRTAAPDKAAGDGWKRLKDYIAGMPQMRAAASPAPRNRQPCRKLPLRSAGGAPTHGARRSCRPPRRR